MGKMFHTILMKYCWWINFRLLDRGKDITIEDILAKVYEATKTDDYLNKVKHMIFVSSNFVCATMEITIWREFSMFPIFYGLVWTILFFIFLSAGVIIFSSWNSGRRERKATGGEQV